MNPIATETHGSTRKGTKMKPCREAPPRHLAGEEGCCAMRMVFAAFFRVFPWPE